MSDSVQNSFIPKRGPVKQVKRVARQQIYILTLVSYVIFFASLVAAGAVFIYDRVVENQLKEAVINFNTIADSFRESDLRRIAGAESRLQQVQSILDKQVSFAYLLEQIESSTVVSSRFSNLNIVRTNQPTVPTRSGATPAILDTGATAKNYFTVSTNVLTDSYDSVMRQRDTLVRSNLVSVLAVAGVSRSFADVSVTASANNNQGVGNELEIATYELSLVVPATNFTVDTARAGERVGGVRQLNQVVSTVVSPPSQEEFEDEDLFE